MALVQADNLYNLEKGNNRGDGGDPWPGTAENTIFNKNSSPNSNLYEGSLSQVSISGISATGPVMTATLSVVDLSITNLAADKTSPQPEGTAINFTETTTGGLAPIQFKWWLFNGTIWSVVKDWSASNTFNWTPVTMGNYKIGVWARSSGNSVDAPENNAFTGIDFTIGLTVTGLTANKTSPQPLGTTVNFTVAAAGGLAPIQFKWWVLFNGVWSVAKDWSASNNFSWTPTAAGNYTVGVWAKSFGNPAGAPENNAFAGINFSIMSPGAQVRAFNNLLICNPNCVPFTGQLTASEGYT